MPPDHLVASALNSESNVQLSLFAGDQMKHRSKQTMAVNGSSGWKALAGLTCG